MTRSAVPPNEAAALLHNSGYSPRVFLSLRDVLQKRIARQDSDSSQILRQAANSGTWVNFTYEIPKDDAREASNLRFTLSL